MAETMQAGRELDALIAEKVMGWRLFESCDETWATTRPVAGPNIAGWNQEVQDVGDVLMFAGRNYGFFKPGWSPSTDIAAAWQVVERMLTLGDEEGAPIMRYSVAPVYRPQMAHWRGRWRVAFGLEQGKADGIYAETMPHAICLAALDVMNKRAAFVAQRPFVEDPNA